MDDNSLPPEAGNDQVTGEAPVETEGDDFEEPIVGPIDTSDWDSTEDEATSESTLRTTTSSTANGTTTTTSPAEYDTSRDPLWHSRILLRHIQRKFADVAIPYDVSSLDENSIRTKARTAAKSFIPTKPDKYAIRFYAVVGWESLYVHSIWDNGSGNFTNTTPPSRYISTFPELKSPLNRCNGFTRVYTWCVPHMGTEYPKS
ncbi:hypothetical protein L917_20251 [Phytophthora nicotianae]|uniref:PiggyBac transposable element-derived protein domain-containing protein n=1 Tax=Phytophthora nicotianae TaxID=4792 RepID=W2K3A2_PHYNI|nr:hypothetical protein L917_20251 [Phytophthora nicotianae]